MITVPDIELELLDHKTAEGVEEYRFRASHDGRHTHCVARDDVEGGKWEVAPLEPPHMCDMTIEEAFTYAREVFALAKFAATLEQARLTVEAPA